MTAIQHGQMLTRLFPSRAAYRAINMLLTFLVAAPRLLSSPRLNQCPECSGVQCASIEVALRMLALTGMEVLALQENVVGPPILEMLFTRDRYACIIQLPDLCTAQGLQHPVHQLGVTLSIQPVAPAAICASQAPLTCSAAPCC